MKEKTISIILEIVCLVLFTITIYPQLFGLCLGLFAYSGILLFSSIVLLFLGVIAAIKYPMKNIYIKTALIYVTIIMLISLVLVGLFSSAIPF